MCEIPMAATAATAAATPAMPDHVFPRPSASLSSSRVTPRTAPRCRRPRHTPAARFGPLGRVGSAGGSGGHRDVVGADSARQGAERRTGGHPGGWANASAIPHNCFCSVACSMLIATLRASLPLTPLRSLLCTPHPLSGGHADGQRGRTAPWGSGAGCGVQVHTSARHTHAALLSQPPVSAVAIGKLHGGKFVCAAVSRLTLGDLAKLPPLAPSCLGAS